MSKLQDFLQVALQATEFLSLSGIVVVEEEKGECRDDEKYLA